MYKGLCITPQSMRRRKMVCDFTILDVITKDVY